LQVIVFDPQYDAYIPLCVAHGGVPKAVKLNTEDWSVPHAGEVPARFAKAVLPECTAAVVQSEAFTV